MNRTRLKATERKFLILKSARRIFSRFGYDAARTQDIAKESGISEAMMYRHFPSKQALYRAVLRQTIREQDESYAVLGPHELSGQGLVNSLRAYFTLVNSAGDDHLKEGFRLLLASLAGDGSFATLVYRRSRRIMGRRIRAALETARIDGDIVGVAITERNTTMFIEHVGTMMNAIQSLRTDAFPYDGDPSEVVRDAVWFCCRGIGFSDEALEAYYSR
ncbi:TetR/AcrR family transcriptional regulator [Novosphingobium sp. P6W]|uniref:TetR/AcrR family transcriptional regulator n=1 Tax=Novosphingobium sp. P6W TaxID=1609758 RepID=UPI0005C2AB2A|nr:TetR/AcrR family transcriptional regulator [Novosphingobium sp. P6W]AXB80352.1 TetR/AcrR family transcriptional regulator [Novosphingobium sp. P6W]KIS29950.1 hypothetical protein TQ38_25495 [Novosphingobium sp. P6W]